VVEEKALEHLVLPLLLVNMALTPVVVEVEVADDLLLL
jgi:hypothetical protein